MEELFRKHSGKDNISQYSLNIVPHASKVSKSGCTWYNLNKGHSILLYS